MRPQRRETAHRPGTGTLPPMERQPRRPPHLGTAPAHRINPAQITPAPAWPPRTATSALGMPSHRTSEYLLLNCASLYGLSLLTFGRECDLRIARSDSRADTGLDVIEVPRSAWMACGATPPFRRTASLMKSFASSPSSVACN